ncbi:hypothetical protein Clacol_000293 [Clathrus columnatus]|uniref:HhH-GPD domain-containing protein n=1 Tax=Clathrus columnatus TaxID=1419009 RepID=A0AAV4ZWE6_9AGAM|nr:hypothetical protein Clacol_000293 [Clathrus columnatus]
MPTTRSRSMKNLSTEATPSKTKRKPNSEIEKSKPVKKAKVEVVISTSKLTATEPQVLPAVLSFSFEAAKQHLIKADSRFQDIFKKLPCRPFEHLERVEPFRTLVTSILGQQISWLAARSITHKFIRLYYPQLPEKLPPVGSTTEPKVPQDVFPTAQQVAETEVDVLRTAGLSTRKAEYVRDLASRFADGRLTTQKLIEADDEELAKLLIEVRGIGRVSANHNLLGANVLIIHPISFNGVWIVDGSAVDMFAIFSLRRPDILPVGDLGVQRGMLRWFLALHSPNDPVNISPKKLPKNPGNVNENDDDANNTKNGFNDVDDSTTTKASVNRTELPGPPPATTLASREDDISSLPPVPVTPVRKKANRIPMASSTEILGTTPSPEQEEEPVDITTTITTTNSTGNLPAFPEPFTPSVNKILKREWPSNEEGTTTSVPPSLPEGLNVTVLKNRLNGKKVKAGFLTPQEMEDLTASWRPYRSLGVYYMWALAEEPTPKK